ncbi:MAG: hypothetical protein ABIO70_19580 [Pseudomonadota bacterium]
MSGAVPLPDPLRFTAAALDRLGGVTERRGDQLTVLLPQEAACSLGIAESADLTAHGDGGTVACGLGSPLLEALVERGRRGVPVCRGRVDMPPASPSWARSLAEGYLIRNGVSSLAKVVLPREPTWYLQVAFAWSLQADERHEGLVLGSVHLEDGARPARAFPLSPPDVPQAAPDPEPPAFDATRAATWIARLGPALVAPAVADVLARTARRQVRDHERIANYYAALVREASTPRRRAAPDVVAAKIAHLLTERDSRLADLGHRYSARIHIQVAGVAFIPVPAVQVTLLARRRKGERTLTLRLPAGARALDHLPCEACGGWCSDPALCDGRLHLLCEACLPVTTGRPRCGVCEREKGP